MKKNSKSKFTLIFKRTTLLVLIVLFISILTSCKKEETISDPIALGYIDNTAHIINKNNETLILDDYDQVLPIFDTYLMVKKDDKWGFISNTGKSVTDIKYSRISQMKENKAVVEYEGQTIIINNNGDILYTFENGYTSYSYFNENKLIIEKNGLLGYLTYNEQTNSFTIIEPTYAFADHFYEGKAVVGQIKEDRVKYNYLNADGSLFYPEFTFDQADRFSEGFAKVGFVEYKLYCTECNTHYTRNPQDENPFTCKYCDVEMTIEEEVYNYNYLKSELSSENKLQYLTYSNNSEIITKQYGTRMQNGIIFVANYIEYDVKDDNEATDYYKDYQFVTSTGEVKYELELSNYAKPTPQSFMPLYPLYLEDTFIFLNGSRRTSVWNIVRHTTYQLFNDITNEYYEDYDFTNVSITLSEEDELIKQFIEENDYNYKIASSYLGSPYEMGEFKFSSVLNQYISLSRIYGNKCGLISITTTPNTDPKPNNLDKQIVVVKYITSIIYDNIVY